MIVGGFEISGGDGYNPRIRLSIEEMMRNRRIKEIDIALVYDLMNDLRCIGCKYLNMSSDVGQLRSNERDGK